MRNVQNFLYLSVKEIKELDRRATEEFGISTETLMENAGRAVAKETIKFLRESKIEKPWKILVLCGGGNNGGDGLVAARILKEKGTLPSVLLLKELADCNEAVRKNFQGLSKWNAQIIVPKQSFDLNLLKNFCLIIDAIFGIGFHGRPMNPIKEIIEKINSCSIPIVAVDLPSGLDADSGKPMKACVKAALTVTMGIMKRGFLNPDSTKWTGKVSIADIGYPKELIQRYSFKN